MNHILEENEYHCEEYIEVEDSVISKCEFEKYEANKYICNHCYQRIDTKNGIISHLRSEHGLAVKLLKCDQCLYKCRLYSMLIDHKRRLHPSKCGYRCHKCPYFARTKYSLLLHFRAKHVHFGSVRFSCDRCPYKSHYNFALRRHKLLRHTVNDDAPSTLKWFQCERCNGDWYSAEWSDV